MSFYDLSLFNRFIARLLIRACVHVFIGHPYFVALQAHPEFCSRPLTPSPPFLGLVAAACGASTLAEQVKRNQTEYKSPHPENAKVMPAREAASSLGQGKPQAVQGVKVAQESS